MHAGDTDGSLLEDAILPEVGALLQPLSPGLVRRLKVAADSDPSSPGAKAAEISESRQPVDGRIQAVEFVAASKVQIVGGDAARDRDFSRVPFVARKNA